MVDEKVSAKDVLLVLSLVGWRLSPRSRPQIPQRKTKPGWQVAAYICQAVPDSSVNSSRSSVLRVRPDWFCFAIVH